MGQVGQTAVQTFTAIQQTEQTANFNCQLLSFTDLCFTDSCTQKCTFYDCTTVVKVSWQITYRGGGGREGDYDDEGQINSR